MASVPAFPSKIGRYQVLGELGRGAMGRVYRAFDPNIGRHIALKTIPLDSGDPELSVRFRREAQAAGILSHPNIVTIYDAGEDGGFLYIAMELVEGETIQQMIARGPAALEQVILIGEQAAAALDHAHARAIVHRDIKPANIMLQGGQVKVTDFGIAKVNTSGLTSTGQVLGTPAYLAPEIVKGGTATARSDIFSLGVVLYELLTGVRAFSGDNLTTVIYRVISEQPSAPTQVLPTLPAGVNYVLLKALMKNPDGRYASCADLIADLKNHAALEEQGRAVAAAHPSEAVAEASRAVSRAADETAQRAARLAAATARMSATSSSRWQFAAVAAGLAAILLAGWVIWQSRSSADATSPDAAPPTQVAAAAPAATGAPSPAIAGRPSAFGSPENDATASASPNAVSASAPAASSTDAPAALLGRVVIHTDPPGARILVDGKPTSYRSPVNFALAPGRHQITVENDGYASATTDVIVEANHSAQVRLEMERTGRRGILSRLPFVR
jgi:serine/threonine-protein kinase